MLEYFLPSVVAKYTGTEPTDDEYLLELKMYHKELGRRIKVQRDIIDEAQLGRRTKAQKVIIDEAEEELEYLREKRRGVKDEIEQVK